MNPSADDAPDPMSTAPADGLTPPPGDDDGSAPPRPRRPLFRRRPKNIAAPNAAGEPAGDTPGDLPATQVEGDGEQPTEVVELPAQPPLNPGRMRRERRHLVGRRQETVYHLGGLAFELFRRDMLAEPVLCRRAEEVAEIDRAVIAIDEELLALEETRRTRRDERRNERREARARQMGPSGYCLSCGAPHTDAANFCANCGAQVVHPTPDDNDQATAVLAVEGSSGATGVIPATPSDTDTGA